MNTDLYMIMQLLQEVIPLDISNKILFHLLGIAKTNTARCIHFSYPKIQRGGLQYEINPQQNKVQEMIMYDIRISQFDENRCKRKRPGAIKNIKKYMKCLESQFKQRYRLLYC